MMVGAGLVMALPVLISPVFPGLDLPWHALFSAALQEPEAFQGSLAAEWQISTYRTCYFLVDWLSVFVGGVLAAMRLVVFLYVVAFVVAAQYFIWVTGKHWAFGWLAAPAAYSMVLAYGFLPLAVAFPAVLWLWAELYRRRDLAWSFGATLLLSVLVAVSHPFAALIALVGGLVIVAAGVERERLQLCSAKVAALILGAMPSLLVLGKLSPETPAGAPKDASILDRLSAMPMSGLGESFSEIPAGVFGFVPVWLAGLLFLSSLAAAGFARFVAREGFGKADRVLMALGLGLLFGYLVTPFHLTWPQMVAAQPRYLPLLWVLLVALVSPRTLPRRVFAAPLALIPTICVGVLALGVMWPFAQHAKEFDRVLAVARPHATTAVLIEQPRAPDRAPAGPLRHFGAYLMLHHGSVVSNIPRWGATQPWVPIRVVAKPPASPSPGYPRSFRFEKYGRGFEQFLIFDRDPKEPHDYFRDAPVELVVRAGHWRLYRTLSKRSGE